MIGLSGLIDSLLTAKSSPRLDVLAIKGETEIGAPGPVLGVGRVDNDVRLPSNAALDRLIPADNAGVLQAEGGPRSVQAELSVAARVISAVLADLHGDAGPVRGAAPAWPSAQTPSAAVVAGMLSRTVSESGLFYESHLVEFAGGTRTLAQMAREPQVQWSPSTSIAVAAVPAAPGELSRQSITPTDMAHMAHMSPVRGSVDDGASLDNIVQGAQPKLSVSDSAHAAHADAKPQAVPQWQNDGSLAAADLDPRPDVVRIQAAYRRGEPPSVAEPDSMPAGKVLETTGARHVGIASVANAPTAAAEVIHPQAVTLVHQQLDLLATAVFRWNGQAWPGVSMDWSIHREIHEREGRGADEEEAPRPWSTTVSLDLPRLGAVDLRLSLAGPSVQARLKAREASTVARLRADSGGLSQRLQTAGLRLHEFHVDAMEQP